MDTQTLQVTRRPDGEIVGPEWRRDFVATAVRDPPDLPLVFVDGVLFEQVFANLLENATGHKDHDHDEGGRTADDLRGRHRSRLASRQ